MLKTPFAGISVPVIAVLFASCVHLEHVHTYATTSIKSLEEANTNSYTFTQSCRDFDCRPDIFYFPKTKTEIGTVFGVGAPVCNCDTFKMADKALMTVNEVLTGYLAALAALSDGKAVDYNFTHLVTAIDSNSLIRSKLSITPSQWSSVGKLATLLANDLLNLYRKKKLREVIVKAEPDFHIVLDVYIEQLRGFEKRILVNDQLWLDNQYSNYLVVNLDPANSAKISAYEAGLVYHAYLEEKEKLHSYREMTEAFIGCLEHIRDGHASLAKGENLSTDDMKQLISQYSADIYSFYSLFISLKKN